MDYLLKKLYAICVLLLVIGGLNWGTVAVFKTDAISALLGKDSIASRLIFIIVALAAVYIGFSRNSYLPFLGETVMPCTALSEKVPDKADLKVRVIAPTGFKVLYWAADAADESDKLKTLKNWKDAYGKFENIGIAIAGDDGSALLHVRKPQRYWVPPGMKLEPHVHYRVCSGDGMLGPVKSLYIEERVEGFATAIHI
jgi:uncharacterized membrane protein YuzA (DUF378 family)